MEVLRKVLSTYLFIVGADKLTVSSPQGPLWSLSTPLYRSAFT